MISDLQSMTEAELKKLSAAQMVDLIMQERTESKVVKQVGDARGMLEYVVEHYDYKGNLTGSEETVTTYKPDGSVDVITKITKDDKGKEAKRTEIAHDGKSAWVKSETKAPRLAVSKGVEATVVPVVPEKKGIYQTVKAKVLGLVKRR